MSNLQHVFLVRSLEDASTVLSHAYALDRSSTFSGSWDEERYLIGDTLRVSCHPVPDSEEGVHFIRVLSRSQDMFDDLLKFARTEVDHV